MSSSVGIILHNMWKVIKFHGSSHHQAVTSVWLVCWTERTSPPVCFFSMACVREMPEQFDDFPQPEHQGRWHHRQIHQASRRLGCPGRRVTKGALRGALCMSLRSKLGVSQAWGTPTPWVSHGLPMKVSHGLPMKETCWIV